MGHQGYVRMRGFNGGVLLGACRSGAAAADPASWTRRKAVTARVSRFRRGEPQAHRAARTRHRRHGCHHTTATMRDITRTFFPGQTCPEKLEKRIPGVPGDPPGAGR